MTSLTNELAVKVGQTNAERNIKSHWMRNIHSKDIVITLSEHQYLLMANGVL